MSYFKDGRVPIELDKTRYMLFSLNVLDEVQEKFGSLDNIGEALERFGSIKWLLTMLINEAAGDGEQLTETQVGRLIGLHNLSYVQERLTEAFTIASDGGKGDAEVADGGEKNAEKAML